MKSQILDLTKVIAFTAFVCFTVCAKGQYALSTAVNTYQELTNPIPLTPGNTWDTNDILPLNFNFNFTVGSEIYTTLDVLAGGGIKFPNLDTRQLSVFHTPFGGFLLNGHGPNGDIAKIGYEITGPVGGQVLKIQWENAGFCQWYTKSDPNDFVNFQIWLYEKSNCMQIHFGNSSTNPGTYGYPIETDNIFGPSVKLHFNSCNDVFGLEGNADSPSCSFLNLCVPNYNFLDNTPSNGITFIICPDLSLDLQPVEINEISISPNPASDYIEIKNIGATCKIQNVIITDITGKTIFKSNVDFNSGSSIKISLHELNNGIYFLIINRNQKGSVTKKFVKKSY